MRSWGSDFLRHWSESSTGAVGRLSCGSIFKQDFKPVQFCLYFILQNRALHGARALWKKCYFPKAAWPKYFTKDTFLFLKIPSQPYDERRSKTGKTREVMSDGWKPEKLARRVFSEEAEQLCCEAVFSEEAEQLCCEAGFERRSWAAMLRSLAYLL